MVESTLAYNLKTNFFADLQFLQSHIANYVASFKAQKVMLPSLKCQIICFWSSFVLFTELSRQQIQLLKIWICHLIVCMAKYPHAKKIKKIHWVVKNVSHTDGQAERMNWTDFTGPLPQKWRFDHVFQKCENKIFFKTIWLHYEPYNKNHYKEKEYNQLSSVLKEFKNNNLYQIYVR